MRRREKPRIFVLLVVALALAGLLASCAPDGSVGESEEKAAAPQGGETQERPRGESTARAGQKAETETKGENTPPGPSPSPPAGPEGDDGRSEFGGFDTAVRVTRVVDGDTVDIAPAVDGEDRVRLIGVDTPETRDPDCGEQPYGDEATAFTTSELQGREVGLEFDTERTDRYGRLLAYVYPSDEEMFNETLLEEGYAQVATFPPNVKYVDRFLAAQEEARAARRGLWGLSPEELAAQTDRGNGIGGEGCEQKTAPKKAEPKKATPAKKTTPPPSESASPPPSKPDPKPKPKTPTTPGLPPGGDKDCKDFSSKEEVQQSIAAGDPHGLDKDGDGKGCESRFR